MSSPHDRVSSLFCVVELLVPVGQEGVALAHRFPDQRCVLWTKQPGLTARCVKVGMGSEERLVRPCLVPTNQQLRVWGLEETAYVSCETEEQSVSHVGTIQSPTLLRSLTFRAFG